MTTTPNTTPAVPPRPDRSRPATPVALATGRYVSRLQAEYQKDKPSAVATLARLRRGLGHPAHLAPGVWGIGGLEELTQLTRAVPGAQNGVEGSAPPPQYGDWQPAEEEAVHLAVSLWALHQQSVHDAPMHVRGWGLGYAVRQLARGQSRTATGDTGTAEQGSTAELHVPETLRKRFVRIGTSSSLESLSVRLREIVLLLRGARVPLDYGRLADELHDWQDETRRAGVRRGWGRDFHLAVAPRADDAPKASGESAGADETAGVDDSMD
ncbi:type I-E CRISPR-associated protein Cse2/CasB [Streptomyces sp. NPDC049906]|uniref:type I-E CRISPR-associated protein Cse2/CasB n=1 Tax=Streptomyces sp. NPDC049906 TaxID=3155656 RepID=UPI00342E2740